MFKCPYSPENVLIYLLLLFDFWTLFQVWYYNFDFIDYVFDQIREFCTIRYHKKNLPPPHLIHSSIFHIRSIVQYIQKNFFYSPLSTCVRLVRNCIFRGIDCNSKFMWTKSNNHLLYRLIRSPFLFFRTYQTPFIKARNYFSYWDSNRNY